MASFPASLPLPVLSSSQAQSADSQQAHSGVEYHVVSQAPEDSNTDTQIFEMAHDLKPEGRAGDAAASYAAYVRTQSLLHSINLGR